MRLTVAAVGKLKDGADREICERYLKRFNGAGKALGLGPLEIVEIAEARGNSEDARRNDEAGRLLKLTAPSSWTIALDVAGQTMSSEAFAAVLGKHKDRGTKHAAILIGGPDGHGAAVHAHAGLRLSLGPMTLPHGLARIVLIEQLYRAATILSGHPYHRA